MRIGSMIISLWCELPELPKERRAISHSWDALSEVYITDLKKSSMDILVEKFGSFFSDKDHKQFTAFYISYNLHWSCHTNIKFVHMYFKYTQEDIKLPHSVMPFILLASSWKQFWWCQLLKMWYDVYFKVYIST